MSLIDDVIANATAKLGAHYLLGTEGPTTFDCSGLMWWIFNQEGAGALIGGSRRRAAGYTRWAADHGQFTRDFRKAERGDLLVYEHPVGHVGIYLGGGDIISALVEPFHVKRTRYNRISVPFYGVIMVDYSGGGRDNPAPDDAPTTVGDEPDDVLLPTDDIAQEDIERATGRALWHIEFEDRPRRAMGGVDVVNKVTRRRPPPPAQPPEATVDEGTALTLDAWQLTKHNIVFAVTSMVYGSFDITDTSFSFTDLLGAANASVGSDINGGITWPFAGCGGLMPGFTGETRYEAWAELDLSGGIPDDWLGVRFYGTGSDWFNGPSSYGSIVGATPIADQMTYLIGWGTPDPTGPGQFATLAEVNVFEDWSVFVPRNVLSAAVQSLVIAPSWIAGGYFCHQELDDPGPGQHYPAIDGSGNAAVALIDSRFIATAVPVVLSGTGRSPWVPGAGAVNGTNATYELISWDGTGTPEARVDDVILAPADYTFDAGALTVTLREPPLSGAEVTFRYIVG